MKAARLHAYGQGLVVDEVPEPAIEGPFDVIVRLGGAGLCRTDLHILEGRFEDRLEVQLPYTLGHESAGWVAEIGPAVENVAVGDAVIVHPLATCGFCRACRAGADMHCERSEFPGLTSDGGFATLKTSARSLVKLPPRLEPHEVAAHADAGLTAYHAVKKAVPLLHPGTTAVVFGAGGLGHIALQCLKAITPAETIAVDSSDAALELAQALGADQALHPDDVAQELADVGAEAVFDFVGEGDAIASAFAIVKPTGAYFAVGYGGTLEVPLIDVVATEVSLMGNLVGTYNELAELMALAEQGRVRLSTTTYPLEAVNDAIEDLRAGRLRGRGILLIA